MGLLDGFIGESWDDPRTMGFLAAMQGLRKRDIAGGLLAYGQAIQEGKQQGLLNEFNRMRLEEAKLGLEDKQRRRQALDSIPSPEMLASQSALSGGGGPTVANAARIPAVSPILQQAYNFTRGGLMEPTDYLKTLTPKELPFNKVDPKDYTPESIQAFSASGGDYTKLVPVRKMDVVGNRAVNLYNAKEGTVFDQIDPNKPFGMVGGQVVPNQAFQSYELNKAKAGKTDVTVNTGQKGLDNELKIRSDFRSEPIYKAHSEVQSAYSQISAALKQQSPAGDLAGATKIMKILDPGSVVRESELGMAMAASGALDRLQHYATNIINGTKLTPKQRADFQMLADKLYQESANQYNSKRKEYEGFATDYGLNPQRILGPAITSPRLPTAPAAPGASPAPKARFLGFE